MFLTCSGGIFLFKTVTWSRWDFSLVRWKQQKTVSHAGTEDWLVLVIFAVSADWRRSVSALPWVFSPLHFFVSGPLPPLCFGVGQPPPSFRSDMIFRHDFNEETVCRFSWFNQIIFFSCVTEETADVQYANKCVLLAFLMQIYQIANSFW